LALYVGDEATQHFGADVLTGELLDGSRKAVVFDAQLCHCAGGFDAWGGELFDRAFEGDHCSRGGEAVSREHDDRSGQLFETDAGGTRGREHEAELFGEFFK